MDKIAKAVVSVGLVGMGLAGMYFRVEYAGWVLFAGCIVAINL